MNNNDIFSDSKKYKVTIEKDDGGDQTTYTIYSSVKGETKHEKDKYVIVKVINVETGNIIYTYKQFNSHSPINTFVKLGGQRDEILLTTNSAGDRRSPNEFGQRDEILQQLTQQVASLPNEFGQEWWFGGRDYMLKLFVNCETGQVFDDPNKREFSNAYKSGSEFIWTGPLIVSPNGHFMFVNGCMWSFPGEWRLYDMRNITTNALSFSYDHLPNPDPSDDDKEARLIRQIDLYDYLTVKEFDKDDERYEYESYWLGDDEMFTFEFVTDDEITVKYYHNKKWKYFNTIDLSQYKSS